MAKNMGKLAVLLSVLVAAGGALAAGGREQVKLNARDNALARGSVIMLTDLGSGWTGGLIKPDLSPPPTCRGYNPKQSDLVLTGVAESHFTHTGLDIQSEAQVLKTAQMVSLDWHRSIDTPGLVPCLRTHLGKSLGAAAKVISFAKTSFPKVATYSAAFRALVDVTAAGRTVHVLVDIVVFGRGRTELTLTTTAPASEASAVTAAETKLARILVARAKA